MDTDKCRGSSNTRNSNLWQDKLRPPPRVTVCSSVSASALATVARNLLPRRGIYEKDKTYSNYGTVRVLVSFPHLTNAFSALFMVFNDSACFLRQLTASLLPGHIQRTKVWFAAQYVVYYPPAIA